MKRQNKIILGVVLLVGYLVKKHISVDVEIEQLEADLGAYNDGWSAGVKWSKAYHDQHHPDCGRCPH